MEHNSAIYEARVVHTRKAGYRNSFKYGIFTFYLDLDEIDSLAEGTWLFRRNGFSLFSYYDRDHICYDGMPTKQSILNYLKTQGFEKPVGRIMLLTNLRVLGYVFNPVSFYFVFDPDGNPMSAIAEVGNTFGELKPYFFEGTDPEKFDFRKRVPKNFYVSPFIQLDSEFDFKLMVPGKDLKIWVDSYENNERSLITSFLGDHRIFSTRNLVLYFFKYPLVTLKVIGAIHWRALLLFINKIPFLRKEDRPDLQTGVHIGKSN